MKTAYVCQPGDYCIVYSKWQDQRNKNRTGKCDWRLKSTAKSKELMMNHLSYASYEQYCVTCSRAEKINSQLSK